LRGVPEEPILPVPVVKINPPVLTISAEA
jgi:hypothetical protein